MFEWSKRHQKAWKEDANNLWESRPAQPPICCCFHFCLALFYYIGRCSGSHGWSECLRETVSGSFMKLSLVFERLCRDDEGKTIPKTELERMKNLGLLVAWLWRNLPRRLPERIFGVFLLQTRWFDNSWYVLNDSTRQHSPLSFHSRKPRWEMISRWTWGKHLGFLATCFSLARTLTRAHWRWSLKQSSRNWTRLWHPPWSTFIKRLRFVLATSLCSSSDPAFCLIRKPRPISYFTFEWLNSSIRVAQQNNFCQHLFNSERLIVQKSNPQSFSSKEVGEAPMFNPRLSTRRVNNKEKMIGSTGQWFIGTMLTTVLLTVP